MFFLQFVNVINEEVLPLSARFDNFEPRIVLNLLLHVGPRRVTVDKVTILKQVHELFLHLGVPIQKTFLAIPIRPKKLVLDLRLF